jgi:hypothetical protein
VLRGKGFKSAEDVFRSIKEGEVGARPREVPRGNASEALAKREGRDLFKTEPGAEGNPQTIIPGAEKISDKALAERKAAEPLRPTKEQKTVGDLPLFSDKPAQGEMFALRHGPVAEKVGALRTVAEKAMDALRRGADEGRADGGRFDGGAWRRRRTTPTPCARRATNGRGATTSSRRTSRRGARPDVGGGRQGERGAADRARSSVRARARTRSLSPRAS